MAQELSKKKLLSKAEEMILKDMDEAMATETLGYLIGEGRIAWRYRVEQVRADLDALVAIKGLT